MGVGWGWGGIRGKVVLKRDFGQKVVLKRRLDIIFQNVKVVYKVFLKVSEANFRLRHLKNVFLEGKKHHKHSYFPKIFACGA